MLLLPFGLLLLVPGVVYAHEGHNSSDATHSDYSAIFRHNDEIAQRLSKDAVQGVRKMSADEGEKFYLEYWSFTDAGALAGYENSTSVFQDSKGRGDVDNTYPIFLARSFPLRSASSLEQSESGWGLETRDFSCPSGTNACTSIGRSDRCCSSGSTCEIVTDTGSGDVGCCPSGETCSGTIGSCQSGYTMCSQALGGGCCIPGYECVPGGCVYISIVTITVDSSVVVSTETWSTIPRTTQSTHSTSATKTTTTDSLVPPARPTSLSTQTHSTTSRVDVCPAGFYACSAVYHGGCCQTGRDCDTTSCPTTSSTTFTSNGETIVIPVTTGGSSGITGRCAKGWFSCADTAGGGCCPSGFACGQSCTATAAQTTIAKEQATRTSNGSRVAKNWVLMIVLYMAIWI